MGEVICLSEFRTRKKALSNSKPEEEGLTAKKPVKPSRLPLPPLGQVFTRNLHVQVADYALLDAFILELLSDPALPSLDGKDNETVLATDYKLQTLRASQPRGYSSSLYYARLHLERSLNLSKHAIKAVNSYAGNSRVIGAILGMFSIAWQIQTGQEPVLDSASFERAHAKK